MHHLFNKPQIITWEKIINVFFIIFFFYISKRELSIHNIKVLVAKFSKHRMKKINTFFFVSFYCISKKELKIHIKKDLNNKLQKIRRV